MTLTSIIIGFQRHVGDTSTSLTNAGRGEPTARWRTVKLDPGCLISIARLCLAPRP